jgi:hypothetical protein
VTLIELLVIMLNLVKHPDALLRSQTILGLLEEISQDQVLVDEEEEEALEESVTA